MFDNKWHDGLTVWGYGGTVFQSEKCRHFSSMRTVPGRWRVGPCLGVAAKRQPKLNADDAIFFRENWRKISVVYAWGNERPRQGEALRLAALTPKRLFPDTNYLLSLISYLLSLISYLSSFISHLGWGKERKNENRTIFESEKSRFGMPGRWA